MIDMDTLILEADKEAEQSRIAFEQMTQRELVEIALTLLAETIRKQRELDDLQGIIR